jgi:hypothetical protein
VARQRNQLHLHRISINRPISGPANPPVGLTLAIVRAVPHPPGKIASGVLMPAPFDALAHRDYQSGHVGGLIQNVIRAGGRGGGHYGTFYGSGHQHDRHVSGMVERANPLDQLKRHRGGEGPSP